MHSTGTFRSLHICVAIVAIMIGLSLAVPPGKERSRRPVEDAGTTVSLTTPKPLSVYEKIQMAERQTSNASSLFNDFRMVMGSNFNWEALLSPAPLGIAVLGDLMVVASSTLDFPIDVQVPEEGFKFIKYPKSFRASLMQISHAGYDAFNRAHTNMDQIRLYAMTAPAYMKDATRVLLSKNPKVINRFLPIPLGRIQEAAQKSVELSAQVVDKFDFVIGLTSEVLTACTATKSTKEIQLADVKKDQQILNVSLVSTSQLLEEMKTEKQKLEKEVDEAHAEVKDAIRKIPTGWKIISMNIVENLGNIVTLKIGKLLNSDDDGRKGTGASSTNPDRGSVADSVSECLVKDREKIDKIFAMAQDFDRLGQSNFSSLDRASSGKFNPDKLHKRVQKIKDSSTDCSLTEDVCDDAAGIIDLLANLTAAGDEDMDFTDAVSQIGQFYSKVMQLKKSAFSASLPLASRKPILEQGTNPSGSASQQAVSNARFVVNNAQRRLEMARQDAEATRKRMIEVNQEYIKILSEMQSLKVDEMRYDEAIELLRKGLETLGKLKEHWSKLVRFFQMIANIVEVVMNKGLSDFNILVNTTSTELDLLTSQVTLDLIYDQVMKASQASFLVHSIANTYVKVSNLYIMDSIAKLDQLMALDSKVNDIAAARYRLLSSCEKDSEEIVRIVMEDKAVLISQIENRAAQIQQEYAFLQEIPEESQDKNEIYDFDF